MTNDNIPTAVWEDTFRLCGVDLKCTVLEDGTRVIENESLDLFFQALANGADISWHELKRFSEWQSGATATPSRRWRITRAIEAPP